MSAVKEELARLARELPEEATWDEALEALEVRQMLEQSLKAAEQGQTIPVNDVRKRLGLPPLS